MDDVTSESLKLENLTPGDFAQARKQAKVLDVLSNPDRIEELLADISRNKPGTLASIGFMK